jgi:hypothetical protein
MATNKGSSGVVKIAASGGSVAVVGEVRSYSIDTTADTVEDTVMGDSARTYLPSLTSATLSVECYWDDGDAPQLVLDEGTDIDWEIHPTGTGAGEKYYEGSGVVTAKTITASFDGMVEASFSVQVSGAVTESTS